MGLIDQKYATGQGCIIKNDCCINNVPSFLYKYCYWAFDLSIYLINIIKFRATLRV